MIIHRHGRAIACAALMLAALCAQGVSAAHAQAMRTSRGVKARVSSKKTPTPPAGDARADAYIAEGDRHADEGDWAAALKSYEQAVAVDPNQPRAHIYIGDAYMSLGKYVEAFAAYKEAVRVAPTNPEAHYSLGAAYNDMAMYGDAFKPFVRAISLNPNHAEAHYGIGYAYLNLENFKESVVYLRRAIKLRNDYPEAHLSLGLAYIGLGQLKLAEEELKMLEGMDALLAKELEKGVREAGAGITRPETRATDDTSAAARAPDVATKQDMRAPGGGQTPPTVTPAPTRKSTVNAASPQRLPEQAAPGGSQLKGSAQSRAAEFSLWDRIKDSADTADFVGYLQTYPQGEFAGLARIRLRVLEARTVAPGVSRTGQKPESTSPRKTDAVAAVAEPATPQPAATPPPATPHGPTVKETLTLLKDAFANKLTYTATAPGQEAEVVSVTYEVMIEYVPLSFEGCHVEWRDRKDTVSVSLSDLDPLAVRVGPRSRPNTTFSTPVWDVSVKTLDGAQAIRAQKGDGSGAVNNYSELNLQFGSAEKAERLARLLQQAIILCKSGL